jgi:hypothetical protein
MAVLVSVTDCLAVLPQGVDIDMQHDLAALAPLEALEMGILVGGGEKMLCDSDQGIGAGVLQQVLEVCWLLTLYGIDGLEKRSGSPRDCSTGAPTDPDVRNSRIRLIRPKL